MATKLEQELRTAAKHLGCWSYNGNDEKPLCDRILAWNGLSILFEAKQTEKDRIQLKCLTENEFSQLKNHAERGRGLSLIIVERNFCNNARCWVVTFETWLESLAGVSRSITWEQWKAHRGRGIPLDDGPRPDCLLEAVRVQRDHSLGTAWNLLSVLYPMAWEQYYRLESALNALEL